MTRPTTIKIPTFFTWSMNRCESSIATVISFHFSYRFSYTLCWISFSISSIWDSVRMCVIPVQPKNKRANTDKSTTLVTYLSLYIFLKTLGFNNIDCWRCCVNLYFILIFSSSNKHNVEHPWINSCSPLSTKPSPFLSIPIFPFFKILSISCVPKWSILTDLVKASKLECTSFDSIFIVEIMDNRQRLSSNKT